MMTSGPTASPPCSVHLLFVFFISVGGDGATAVNWQSPASSPWCRGRSDSDWRRTRHETEVYAVNAPPSSIFRGVLFDGQARDAARLMTSRRAKCVTPKTRCTFVKFHRQTALVGPGHPSSLPASIPSSTAHPPPSHLQAVSSHAQSLWPHPLLSSPHGSVMGDTTQPSLYAQEQAGGGGAYTFSTDFGLSSSAAGRFRFGGGRRWEPEVVWERKRVWRGRRRVWEWVRRVRGFECA
ncbi:hypothetical protein DFH06DRAFT_1486825 [Mycena polygramma]|nr:hypothetical protein DFH06DRAFT_1486825 [Mycena polygramma]